jgi:2-amino-4-hydroxy-6-hydroxymethyldihydropteridine diphosphokinase
MREAVRAFIAVGANLDPEPNILQALRLLRAQLRLTAVSTFYETEPIVAPGQPLYLNGVVAAECAVGLRELKFQVLRPIEEKLGRVRTAERYAARPIDLDILLFGETVCVEQDLCVPDPELRRRPFLGAALLELALDLVLPDTGERLAGLVDAEAVARLKPATDFSRMAKEMIPV